MLLSPCIARRHLAPVEHFIAGRGQQQVAIKLRQLRSVQHLQFSNVLRPEVKTVFGMPRLLLADVFLEIPRRINRGIDQHRTTAQLLGQRGRIEAAQRGTDQRQ